MSVVLCARGRQARLPVASALCPVPGAPTPGAAPPCPVPVTRQRPFLGVLPCPALAYLSLLSACTNFSPAAASTKRSLRRLSAGHAVSKRTQRTPNARTPSALSTVN